MGGGEAVLSEKENGNRYETKMEKKHCVHNVILHVVWDHADGGMGGACLCRDSEHDMVGRVPDDGYEVTVPPCFRKQWQLSCFVLWRQKFCQL